MINFIAEELPEACAIREAREEVGVNVEITGAYAPINFDYPERRITLYPFDCMIVSGEPQPLEVAALRWLKPDELKGEDFPPANAPLIQNIKNRTYAKGGSTSF